MCELTDQLKAAWRNGAYFDTPDGFEEVDEGDWVQDHKYQSRTCVVKHITTGRCFEVHHSRSGSYHTDWYYDTPEVGSEVRKVTKTITVEKWEAVPSA